MPAPLRPVALRRRLAAPATLVGSVVVAWLLVGLAALDPVLAVLAVGAAGLALTVLLRGIEGTAALVLVLATFFAPLNSVRPSSAASFVTAADLLYVLGFGILFPVLLRRRLVAPPLYLIGGGIVVTLGLLASLASEGPGLSLNHMVRLLTAAFGLPLAMMWWRPSSTWIRRLATAYLAGVVVSVLHALVSGPDATGRYVGFTTHYNYFGITTLLAAAIVPYVVAVSPPGRRWALWFAGLICLYGIWISGSRAALLVIVVVAAIYPFLERSVNAFAVLAVAGTTVLALSGRLLDDSGDNALSRLLGGGGADYADLERQKALEVALKAFHAHPVIGNGFAQALEAHNIYLEIAVSVGVIGALGYVLMLVPMVQPLVRSGFPHHRLAYPALSYALIGLITNALWDRFIWAALALALLVPALEAEERLLDQLDRPDNQRDDEPVDRPVPVLEGAS